MLSSNSVDVAGAPLDGSAHAQDAIAWKTGTSYGYRDAWAIGVTDDWTFGVWIGRPDGTPSPGQYGAVTALPLMFSVATMLPATHANPRLPRPASVGAVDICWPLGGAASSTPTALCRDRRVAWTLGGALPPTFPERDVSAWMGGLLSVRVDAHQRRLSATCHGIGEHTLTLARWPALATPWLTPADAKAAALPPLAPGCDPDSLEVANPIRIAGISDGATLRAAPNSDVPLSVTLRALGTVERVQWLLDGRLQGDSLGAAPMRLVLAQPGTHQVTALSAHGAFSRLKLVVLPSPAPSASASRTASLQR